MAEYRIVLARSADRDLQKLSSRLQARLVKAIDSLVTDARPSGVQKLRGSTSLWRIRVGDYRVIYRIDDAERMVDVSHIFGTAEKPTSKIPTVYRL